MRKVHPGTVSRWDCKEKPSNLSILWRVNVGGAGYRIDRPYPSNHL